MRALWRVDLSATGRGEAKADLQVDFDGGVPVGHLATALAEHLGHPPHRDGPGDPAGSLTLAGASGPLDPRAPAGGCVPRSGSTIRLASTEEPRGAAAQRVPSPVVVTPAADPAAEMRLDYGSNRLLEGIEVRVGATAYLLDHGGGPVSVNGVFVRGHATLADGDLLRVGSWSATVGLQGVLRPPPTGGPTIEVPVARGTVLEHEPVAVEVPDPPERARMPRFPWLTASAPLAMAAVAWFTTRSALLVAFMGFSFVYVLASAIESRIETRAADVFAVEQFRARVEELRCELDRLAREQVHRDEVQHPETSEVLGWVAPLSHRLWERGEDHPAPLEVRIGHALSPPDDTVRGGTRGRPELRRELDELLAHNDGSQRPLVVDLGATGGLALIGDEEVVGNLAASIVGQLCGLVPPGSLRLELPQVGHRWDWARWLPHNGTASPRTLRVLDAAGAPGTGGSVGSPADSTADGTTSSAPAGGAGGAPVPIWVAPDTRGLSRSVRAVVHVDNHGIATLQIDNAAATEFTTETVDTARLEAAARHMAGMRRGSPDDLGGELTLASIGFRADPSTITSAWAPQRARSTPPGATGRAPTGLATTIGTVVGGGHMTIDLRRDGPHVLIAGTTGSGKSELLRTLLLGLAANHCPGRLTMYLVDYKGGAAFGPLTELPHCVGMMTDLRGDGTGRTVTALRAELARRELLLHGAGAADLEELEDGLRPPALLVVIDEFATLVAEAPEFLDGVLDVAQRGRSLGIHLVLATQRPAGVVSDSIRANTNLRIALRLPDAHDSEDVVGCPDASEIPRNEPGRAILRLGHDELLAVRCAHSGAPEACGSGVQVRRMGSANAPPGGAGCAGSPSGADGPAVPRELPTPLGEAPARRSEMEAMVEAIRSAHHGSGAPEPFRPVPPVLPEHLPRTATAPGGSRHEPVPVGVVDRPDRQGHEELRIHPLDAGGVLVLGARRSGATNLLALLARQLHGRGGWSIHVIDAGGGITSALGRGVVDEATNAGDPEGVRRILCNVTGSSRALLVVDGWSGFEQSQEPVNRGWALDTVADLASGSIAGDCLVAISARRRNEVPPTLLAQLTQRVLLRTVDPDEAAMCDAPAGLADSELPAGRGWFGGHWVQLALANPPALRPAGGGTAEGPPGRFRAGRPGTRLPEPPRLPRQVHPDQVAGASGAPWSLPLGLGGTSLRPVALDLGARHALVVGAPASGRSTTLATIGAAADALGHRVLGGADAAAVARAGLDHLQRRPRQPAVVLLDDLEEHLDDPDTLDALGSMVDATRRSELRLVASCDPFTLARAYEEPLLRLRAMRTGVVLGHRREELVELLHGVVEPRDDVPDAPGRGWLLSAGAAELVQVARIPGRSPG